MKFVDRLKYDEKGLIPAIIQDFETKEVLMLAYMNRESIEKMLESGKTCFFSRSRKKLWVKGETSGHFQVVQTIDFDCDEDALLIGVRQIGAACHENYRSCFFRRYQQGNIQIVGEKKIR